MPITTLINTSTLLAGGGMETSGQSVQVAPAVANERAEEAPSALLSHVSGDQNGTLYVLQGIDPTVLNAVVDPTLAPDTVLVTTHAFVGGTPANYSDALRAPYVRAIYVNGVANQTRFALWVGAVLS